LVGVVRSRTQATEFFSQYLNSCWNCTQTITRENKLKLQLD
jgi:hypothetical protein